MRPFDFGSVGILQIGDERYGFRPTELYQEYESAPILKGEFLPDVFDRTNLMVRARKYLAGMNEVARDPEIKNVYFNDPVTVVIWSDGSKTIVRCQPGDTYSKETGLALCIAKKFLGNKGNFNKVFKKWIHEETEPVKELSVNDMRVALEDFCKAQGLCSQCPLSMPVCRCGNDTHFTVKNYDGSYNMPDDEIRAAYRVVFNRK